MKVRILSLIFASAFILASFCALPASAASSGELEYDGVVFMGDFEKIVNGYVIVYPEELPTTDKKYPIVVWANGTMCAPALYAGLLADIARAGYVVVASSDMMAADGKRQVSSIDYIFGEDADPIFKGKLDDTRIAAVGHSQGGRSSVNAAVLDDRIKCVVSIAGSNYKKEAQKLSTPTFFITGTLDEIVNSTLWVKPAYKACTGPAVYASIKNGVHTTCIMDPDFVAKYTVKWLDAWLKDDADAADAFGAFGSLSQEKKWTDIKRKNLPEDFAGSIIGEGSLYIIIAVTLAALAAIAIIVVLAKKKKKSA